MTDHEADLANQHIRLKELVASDGWQICFAKWTKQLESHHDKLKSEDCENRDWQAGFVMGFEKMLHWPAIRIAEIERDWKK